MIVKIGRPQRSGTRSPRSSHFVSRTESATGWRTIVPFPVISPPREVAGRPGPQQRVQSCDLRVLPCGEAATDHWVQSGPWEEISSFRSLRPDGGPGRRKGQPHIPDWPKSASRESSGTAARASSSEMIKSAFKVTKSRLGVASVEAAAAAHVAARGVCQLKLEVSANSWARVSIFAN